MKKFILPLCCLLFAIISVFTMVACSNNKFVGNWEIEGFTVYLGEENYSYSYEEAQSFTVKEALTNEDKAQNIVASMLSQSLNKIEFRADGTMSIDNAENTSKWEEENNTVYTTDNQQDRDKTYFVIENEKLVYCAKLKEIGVSEDVTLFQMIFNKI